MTESSHGHNVEQTPLLSFRNGSSSLNFESTSETAPDVPFPVINDIKTAHLRLKATSTFRKWRSSITTAPKQQGVRYSRVSDRDAPFKQSYGKLAIRRSLPWDAGNLKNSDTYHLIVATDTWLLLLIVSVLYFAIIIVFAGLFYAASDSCNLELTSFREAVLLSTQAQTTIGFGVPDPYFNNCLPGTLILLVQAIVGLLVDSFVIGVLFSRFSRGTTRAKSIIFSDKAVIRAIRGHVCVWVMSILRCYNHCVSLFSSLYLFLESETHVRVVVSVVPDDPSDMHKQALLESHVRLYGILHHALPHGNKVYFQTHALRLVHPNVCFNAGEA